MLNLRKRTIQALTLSTGILGILTLSWLIFDYAMYSRIRPLVLRFEELGSLEKLSVCVWFSYLFMFFFHLLAGSTLVLQMRYLRKIRALSIIAVVTGVVSFLGVFSDWAVMGDIGKEYKMGWDTAGEWKILYTILTIHTVFALLVTGISLGLSRWLRGSEVRTQIPARDEIVFVVSQYVGMICGLIGLAFVFLGLVVGRQVKVSVYHSVASTILILIPYGLIVSYWLILRLKERIGAWYDEKQWRDVTRAGFTTLLMLVPALSFFFIAYSLAGKHYATSTLWFPFTLFLILLLFSFFTLLNYRRE